MAFTEKKGFEDTLKSFGLSEYLKNLIFCACTKTKGLEDTLKLFGVSEYVKYLHFLWMYKKQSF